MGAIGKVVSIIGPVIDVQYAEGHLPTIHNAVVVRSDKGESAVDINVTAEVALHLGEGRVRCVAMEPTDGMVRGMKAEDTGSPITIPVGPAVLGRILNVIGKPVDNLGPVNAEKSVSYRHLRAHETPEHLVCRLLL